MMLVEMLVDHKTGKCNGCMTQLISGPSAEVSHLILALGLTFFGRDSEYGFFDKIILYALYLRGNLSP
jgi:hypothetical protein